MQLKKKKKASEEINCPCYDYIRYKHNIQPWVFFNVILYFSRGE